MPTSIAQASSPRLSLAHAAATLPGRLVLALAGTVLVALAAHVALPLPFTPVPLTLQPLAVLLVGLALGPLEGSLCLLAYLAEGACGLPVFSPTGPGGLLQLFGPTGGFLLSYPLVAALAGGAVRALRGRCSPFLAALFASSLAVALLFLCGASWLLRAHLSLHAVWIAAVAPFLPGEAVKVLVAAGLYSTFTRGRRIQ